SAAGSAAAMAATMVPVAAESPAAAAPGSRGPLFVAIGALLLLLVGVGAAFGLGFIGQRPDPLAAPGPSAAAASAALPAAAPETAPASAAGPAGPAEPAPSETVTVEIATDPEDAELYLDGLRIPNPFDGELPKTIEPRRLEARRSGRVTIVQDLVLQFPQRVRLRMQRGDGTDDRRSERSRSSTSRMNSRPRGSSEATTSAMVTPPATSAMTTSAMATEGSASGAPPSPASTSTMAEPNPSEMQGTPPTEMRGRLKKIF
ncbi:MAG: hypothetical protein OEY14_03990, partial [Myxococcales bacterium]|nr:hypothetical protein [Myxococcales bacterium]